MVKTAQDIILKPVITEASMEDLRAGKYTFKVALTANKIEIKDAVEEIFGVKVASVHTMRVRGRFRRMGRNEVLLQPGKRLSLPLPRALRPSPSLTA